jgi:hypothetical protein
VTTTGTNIFTMTRDDLVKAVMRNLQALGAGETPITEDYTNITQAMNVVIKSWAKKGIALWVTQEVAIPMVAGVAKYPLGPSAGYVHSVTATGGAGYTTGGTWTATNGTTGTAASGTYTVSGGAPAVFTILVAGDSYTAAPTTFTLSGPGAGAVISSVIVGVTMSRPLRIIDGTFLRNAQGYDTQLLPVSRQEYDVLGSKTSSGVPNQFYYDSQIANGQLYMYSVPTDSTATIYAQTQRQFYDMVASGDNFDFPSEWLQPLKWGVTEELMLEYMVPDKVFPYIMGKAAATCEESFAFSQEDTSVFFSPDPRMSMGYGRG